MRKAFSDAGFILASNLLFSFCLVALQVFVTRSTSLEEYGKFAAAQALQAIIEATFLARSGEIALQTIGKAWMKDDFHLARMEARRIFWSDLLINSAIMVLMAFFAFGLGRRFGLIPGYMCGLSTSILAQSGYGAYKGIFIISGRLKEQAKFEMWANFVMLGAGVTGCLLASIPGLIAGISFAALFKTILAWALTRRFWPDLAKVAPMSKPYSLKNDGIAWGWSSLLRNAFATGAGNIDILILNAFLGPEKTAVYKIAKSLAAIPGRFAAPIWSSLRPGLLRAWHTSDVHSLRTSIFGPGSGLLACLAIGIIPAWWLAPVALNLYGPQYAQARWVFLPLLVGNWVWVSCTGWYSFWVIITEARKAGIYMYMGFFTMTALVGLVCNRSPVSMATGMAASMTIISAACWVSSARRISSLKPV